MKHYDNIEQYIDGFKQTMLIYRMSKIGVYRNSLEYSRRELGYQEPPIVTGVAHADYDLMNVCTQSINPFVLGQPITLNKAMCIKRMKEVVHTNILRYVRDEYPNKEVKALLGSIQNRNIPVKEENVKALINYGIEILYVVDLPRNTKMALITHLFKKHLE